MINWAILGNAQIARVCVAPAIVKAHNGRLHAVASRTLDRAQALVDAVGQGQAVAGYDAVLRDPAVDAVYIPLPNQLHAEWAIKALAAGKHVLVEKPMAMNAAEAQAMADAAAQHERYLMEAFMYRFHPRAQRIKQMVARGELGKIGRIRTAFTFPVVRDGSNERLFLPEMGGGSLWDVGCYGVSVARWLLDAEPVAVTAHAVYGDSGVDINFSGVLQFASGAQAIVESGFSSALQQTFAVYGDQGAVELPHDAFVPWEKDAVFTWRAHSAETGTLVTTPGADEYQLMVEQFADVVLGAAAPAFTPDESVRQMRVMDALAQAARFGRTISIE